MMCGPLSKQQVSWVSHSVASDISGVGNTPAAGQKSHGESVPADVALALGNMHFLSHTEAPLTLPCQLPCTTSGTSHDLTFQISSIIYFCYMQSPGCLLGTAN